MEMAFYTVIFEYREGTYISQVQALDETEAFKAWATEINPNKIQYFGEKLKEKMIEDTQNKDYEPTLIAGLKNIWCAGCSLSALINIIKTES